jgi:hemolysin D
MTEKIMSEVQPPDRSPFATGRTLSVDAMDFVPGLLAIQESPPARLPKAVMYLVVLLFGILLLWACFGKLDIVASADGRLVPKSYVKVVQPADAGIVQEILVSEGETVKAGQVLMRMDTKLAQADGRALQSELTLRSLQLRRIDAELSGGSMPHKKGDDNELFRQVDAQLRERRQNHMNGIAQQQEGLKKAKLEYQAAQEVMAKLKEVAPLVKQQADAYADLAKQGFAGQLMLREKQREYIEKSQDVKAQSATVESLQAAFAQAEQQLSQVSSRYRSDLRNERIEAQGQHDKLLQDALKLEHRSGLLELKASQGGIVKDIATHTIGSVVSPGTVLLTIVPEHEPLLAEVMVKNDDVGFVHREQKVKVKLVAYPFEKYGMLDGKISHVSADANEVQAPVNDSNKNQAVSQGATYKVLVTLDEQKLRARGEQFKLVPGMQVIAEIKQGNRTVMEYLLSPVQKALHDSGREK